MKLKKLNALFGVWSDKDGKQIDCAGNSKENDAKIRKKGYAKSFQTKNWNIKVFLYVLWNISKYFANY